MNSFAQKYVFVESIVIIHFAIRKSDLG